MKKNKIFIIAEAGVNHNGSLKNAINGNVVLNLGIGYPF